jgi:hypothetical protein
MSIGEFVRNLFSVSEVKRLRLVADLLQRENDQLRERVFALEDERVALAKILRCEQRIR